MQQARPPSKLSQWVAKFKTPFTRDYWADLFEATDNETLVDRKVLSYSYIEAGLIEFAGA